MSIEYLDNQNTSAIEDVNFPIDLGTINHTQGDSFFLSFSFQDAYKNPVDISTYTINMDIVDKDYNLEYRLQTGDIIVDSTPKGDENNVSDELNIGVNGSNIPSTPGTYLFDIQFKDDNNDVQTIFKGEILIERDVTQNSI